jgi:hypothetical protein
LRADCRARITAGYNVGVIDRPSFSFGAYMVAAPGTPTEIHDWVAGIFGEFRELELHLLMGRLAASLAGGGGAGWQRREWR